MLESIWIATSLPVTLRSRLKAYGFEGERLILRGPSAHPEMLEQYGEIDIALAPFPFNGGMTTLETLWMGVPVVTIAGNSVVSRQTVSALTNIGLADELPSPISKPTFRAPLLWRIIARD